MTEAHIPPVGAVVLLFLAPIHVRGSDMPGEVFISYGRDDDARFVEWLCRELESRRIEVWWDQESMKSRGLTLRQEIRDAIWGSDRVLAVIGPAALSSDYVRLEWEFALSYCKGVLPILRCGEAPNETDPDPVIREIAALHWLDFRSDRDQADALEQLLRHLNEPLPEFARLYNVPKLPPHYLPRRADIERIGESLSISMETPTFITSSRRGTALQGMGGIGKSVLAAAVAASVRTRLNFRDGVVWISAGIEATPLECLNQLALALGNDVGAFSTIELAMRALSQQLEDKCCLIVLDDLWSLEQAEPLWKLLGAQCELLITSRQGNLVTELGAHEIPIDILSPEAALVLLGGWVGCEEPLPPEANEVAKQCGYLPLALAMAGAWIHDGVDWRDILEALGEADLGFIERSFPDYPYQDLFKVFQLSLDALKRHEPEALDCYLDLAVFPPDTQISEAAVRTLWGHRYGLSSRQVGRCLVSLKSRALLSLSEEGLRTMALHDLLHDYLVAKARDENRMVALHESLLAAYKAQSGQGWASGPNDGYFFQRLTWHLKEAGRLSELRALLLDMDWLINRSAATSVAELAAEFDLLPEDKGLRWVQGALRLAAPKMTGAPGELANQLLGRLIGIDSREVETLLEGIVASQHKPALRPLAPCLLEPGGHILQDIPSGDSLNAVAVTHDGRYAVAGGSLGTLKVVDLKSYQVRTLKGQQHEVESLAITPDSKWVVVGERHFRVSKWNLMDGQQISLPEAGDHTITVAVSSDGKKIIAGSDLDGLRVCDLSDGRLVDRLKMDWPAIDSLVALPNNLLFSSRDLCLRDLKADLGSPPIQCFGGPDLSFRHGDHAVEVALDKSVVIAVRVDRDLSERMVFELNDDRLELRERRQGGGTCIACDGRYVVIGRWGKDIEVIDLKSNRSAATLKGHTDSVHGVALTPDGNRLVSVSWDETLKVWDFKKVLENAERFGLGAEVLLISRDQSRALIRPMRHRVELRALDLGISLRELEGKDQQETFVRSAVASADGSQILIALTDGTVRRWRFDTGEELGRYAFAADSLLMAGGKEYGFFFGNRWSPSAVRLMEFGGDQRWEIPCVEKPKFYGDFANSPFRFVSGWSIRWATGDTIELVPKGGDEPSCCFKADAELDALALWPEQHRVIARDRVGRVFFLEIG